MPISKRYACGDVSVAVWTIEETSERLGAMLGDDVLLRQARSFGGEARRAEWLAVRLLLRAMLGGEARIDYTADGRPFLVGACGHISISHTQGVALLAYSPRRPIGLDAELVTRKVGVARSFVMADGECDVLPAETRQAYMLLRWTAYEALYKLVGGNGYKERLSMPVFVPAQGGVFAVALACGDGVVQQFSLSYIVDDGLLLSICTVGGDAVPLVRV